MIIPCTAGSIRVQLVLCTCLDFSVAAFSIQRAYSSRCGQKIEPMKGVRVKKVGVTIVLFADENVQRLCIIKRTC